MDSDSQVFLKNLNERIDSLARNCILELRNLINDLKIYFIGPPINDPLIRPWSVVGRYVRRCIIIYEKMPFDKLVTLCKQASVQFKDLSAVISKNRKISESAVKLNELNIQNSDNPIDSHYEIENSNSPVSGALFLNDESYLTMTGDCFNRSANADCSGMDMDESAVSLNQINNTSLNCSNNREFINRFYSQTVFNSKALTSTVSAQRTQALGNFKTNDKADNLVNLTKASKSTQSTVTSNNTKLPTTTASQTTARTNNAKTNLEAGINDSMPPPPVAALVATVSTANSALPFAFSLKNGCAYSRRIAEYFVAQQASLIENNEHDALSPAELNQKIDELLAFDVNFADAYYLKYLNFMRLRDYPSSLKALHDYFDRAIYAGSVSLAALNLCSLEYRFDNKENAFFALKEAITSAHHEGDNACLQHCLVFH